MDTIIKTIQISERLFMGHQIDLKLPLSARGGLLSKFSRTCNKMDSKLLELVNPCHHGNMMTNTTL